MGHKYGAGQAVYYNPPVRHSAPPGAYKLCDLALNEEAVGSGRFIKRSSQSKEAGRHSRRDAVQSWCWVSFSFFNLIY